MPHFAILNRWQRSVNATGVLLRLASCLAAIIIFGTPLAFAEVSKGHRILMERGLQVQGMVTKDDVFHLNTYSNANYTAIHWLWESNPAQHGTVPGFPWARWVNNETKMPGATEQPYLNQLVALQLGDEWNLNDSGTRDRAVNWFNAIRNQWPNTLLYMNNWGGQVNDAAFGDFVTRAKPDMLCFDTYPFKSTYPTGPPNAPAYGSPTNWYGELRRYRVYALNAGIPSAVYRQTFHAVQDYDQTVYRDPSPSEMNLNTFGALAFGVTTFIDFTYNTGASSLFNQPGGDSNPGPGYHQQTNINRQARNLGKSLVHLVGLDNLPNGGQPTMDIMFLRGKTGPNATDVTPLPSGFVADNNSPNSFSEWELRRNDPYMAGWVVTNLGTKNNGMKGDVIISWFKPLDPAKDEANDAADELYFMVTNGLTGPDGTAEDYKQEIQVNFFADVTPSLQRLNADTGLVEIVPLPIIPSSGGRRKLVIQLDGGAGQLFKFNTGHGFFGTTAALSGDFNQDHVVDASDYTVWRNGLGSTYSQSAYNVWRSNFGAKMVASSSYLSETIPEPMTTTMILTGILTIFTGRRSQAIQTRFRMSNRPSLPQAN